MQRKALFCELRCELQCELKRELKRELQRELKRELKRESPVLEAAVSTHHFCQLFFGFDFVFTIQHVRGNQAIGDFA